MSDKYSLKESIVYVFPFTAFPQADVPYADKLVSCSFGTPQT